MVDVWNYILYIFAFFLGKQSTIQMIKLKVYIALLFCHFYTLYRHDTTLTLKWIRGGGG